MAAVLDLYSPRIAEEYKQARWGPEMLASTLGDAAKQLFAYSINKQEIEQAYGESAEKAESEKMKRYWDDKMKANEFASRRFNTAQTALRVDPENPAAWQEFSDALFESSGVRPDESRKKDIIDHLIEYTTDPQTGGPNTKAMEITANATKLEGPTGELIKNWTILREQGVADDDFRMLSIRDQLAKNAATTVGEWQGELLSKMTPTAAIAMWEYWQTLGPPGSSTSLTVKMPEGGERKTVVDAIVLRKKMEDIRNLWNKVKEKYAQNWINKPTGTGAETLQAFFTSIGKGDPLITELQRSVLDYQQDRVRALTGAQHSDIETERYIGDTFGRGGSIISNQMNKDTFDTTLDLNQKWGIDYLDALIKVQKGYNLRTPGDVKPGEPPIEPSGGPTPAQPSSATINQSSKGEKPSPQGRLEQLEARKAELEREKAASQKTKTLKKRRQERERGGTAETPPPVEPQSMLFNRALEMLGPGSYGVG